MASRGNLTWAAATEEKMQEKNLMSTALQMSWTMKAHLMKAI
jgi:hypothetical protein